MYRKFWLELACWCLCVCVKVLLAGCVMATQGGRAPFVLLYLVVDPAEYGGRMAPPFIPRQRPAYWSLRKTPEEAIGRWSWSRASAYESLQHCLLLTYKLTAHGLGCAVLGNGMLSIVHWGNDGSLSGLRLRSLTLEREFWCEDLPMLRLQNVQNVLQLIPNAHEYVQIS